MAAARAGLAEVMAGQLAEQKGDKAVQTIGAQMVTDHTKVNNQLKMTAQQLGLMVPTTPSLKQQAEYAMLQKTTGSTFSTDYLSAQRKDHLLAIAVFKKEATMGENPQLKSLAEQSLPTLHQHLQMIESAQSHSATGS